MMNSLRMQRKLDHIFGAIVTLLRPFFAPGLLAVVLALCAAGPVHAQSVQTAPFDQLERELEARITFDTLPPRREPGIAFDAPMRMGRAWLGQHFEGQTLQPQNGFDRLSGAPLSPLSLRTGPTHRNLSVAQHQGFESNALFPLGDTGFPALDARGEGALAILFDHDQWAIALRVHSDYAAPLGGAPKPGHVTLHLYTRQGALIARHRAALETGITEIGLRRLGGVPDIAGVTLTNDDPGGIAIDDILYHTAPAAF
jgi:hypothetical protein